MAAGVEDKPGTLNNSFSLSNESPKRKVALRMSIIARLLRNNFDRKVAALNVTRSQWTMIVSVARCPGATQRTIAENLEISEASAGRLIDRLCGDGLLERRQRHDDRRARAVYPAQAADPLLEKLGKIATESEHRMFRGFSDEEVDQLRGYVERIYENLSRG